MIYFTSDLHLNHYNIIKYCNRPFETIEEHDLELIKKWNNKIKNSNDEIYILGDFMLSTNISKFESFITKLNGIKHLILGNHDKIKLKIYNKYFKTVSKNKVLKINNKTIIMNHYMPKSKFNKRIKKLNLLFLHGHVHGNKTSLCKNVIDVGVDCWDYTPVNLNEIFFRSVAQPG